CGTSNLRCGAGLFTRWTRACAPIWPHRPNTAGIFIIYGNTRANESLFVPTYSFEPIVSFVRLSVEFDAPCVRAALAGQYRQIRSRVDSDDVDDSCAVAGVNIGSGHCERA